LACPGWHVNSVTPEDVTSRTYAEKRPYLLLQSLGREATRIDDLRSYLNGAVLPQVWPQLFLPARVRQSWEERLPVLSFNPPVN
jgi:hypothetical protein